MDPKGKINTSSFLNLQSEYLYEKDKYVNSKDKKKVPKKVERVVTLKKSDPGDSEESEWIKCRDALERKARLYDESRKRESSGNDGYRMNSTHPPAGLDLKNVSEREREGSQDFESILFGSETVEVIDEFNRTRKIKISDASNIDEITPNDQEFHFNIESDIRTVGLGFYKFSSFARATQMRDLNTLRQETVAGRHSHAELTRRRKEYLRHRLEIARERRKRLSLL